MNNGNTNRWGSNAAYNTTKKALEKIKEYKIVYWNDSEISTIPLATFAASGCSCAVLRNGGLERGLLHVYSSQKEVDECLNDTELKIGRGLAGFEAYLIGGWETYILEEALVKKGCNIIAKYPKDKYSKRRIKDIIVLPKQRIIRIYTSERKPIGKKF